MYQKAKKLLAALCVFALVFMALPKVPVKAATAEPKFEKSPANWYENDSNKGKYTYKLVNLQKGQTVKWSVSGAGKPYVSLKTDSTKVTKGFAENVLTVKTDGKLEAKNKTVKLTAKVYSAAGKLQYTTIATAKIKINPTKVTLTLPEEAKDGLFVGKSYDFGYELTPANATTANVWTVTGKDGVDYSSYMNSEGVFTPMKAGSYKITLAAKSGTKTKKSASTSVEVSDYLVSVKQLTADKIELTYSGDVHELGYEEELTIKNTVGAEMVVRNTAYSADGKTLTATLYSSLKDGVVYTVSDGITPLEFTASVGIPVDLQILTQRVTVGKETAIEYVLYDEKGINVTEAYPGTIEYSAEVTNGYLNDANKLYMTTVGKTATVTLNYVSKTDNAINLDATAVIMCVAAQTSGETNFTLTNSMEEPDYTADSYKDVRKASIGTTYYAHFRALDTDKSEIKYSSIKYVSSNPDVLIITPTGKITPITSGTVKVIVTGIYAGEEYNYSYDVTIAEAPYLKTLKLSQSSVTMSNASDHEYREYISVTASDQYGESFPLTNETASIVDNSVYKQSLVSYDAVSDRLVVTASLKTPGTYSYTLTLTQDGRSASAAVTVVVVAVPTTGTETYEIKIDKNKADLSLNADVASSQYVNARLAKYRNGLFVGYTGFTSATVTMDGYYYGTDLTLGGTNAKQTLAPSNLLSLKTLDITSGLCRKAETGTYTVSLQYYSTADKGSMTLTTKLTLTDTQDEPEVRIDRITSNKSCVTALELAQNCLTPEMGTITECVVTGETLPGSKVALKSGDQINIKSVTVVGNYTIAGGQIVTVTYKIPVGKTLTNI